MIARRVCDIVFAAIALCMSAPFAVVAIGLVVANLGLPLLFRQTRSGLGGRSFTLYKFRSMPEARDERGVLLSDDARLTRFGKAFRRSRLDELPQLFNVLAGNMSIVGPRPLLPETIAAAGRAGIERGRAAPGLTGWAQVTGNTLLSDEEKVALDLWYLDHRTLALDLLVVIRTLAIPITGERRDAAALQRVSCEP
ncbi:MAG TPA: sugar transferase [Sphingomonas sp.]|jgi:lipopolysaccharide/colanic/teichoic acid biosynthesis glycosyltransferase